jgi:hypothetical protein
VWRRSPLLLGILLLSACASSTTTPGINSPSPYTTPSAAASTPSAAALSCTKSADASTNWPSAAQLPSDPAVSNANVAGDALTLTFIKGTPAFSVTQQSSANFTKDPSGQAVALKGTSGVVIHLTGMRGGQSNDTGPANFDATGPLVLQVQKIGDFEGTLTFAVGTSGPACAHVISTPNGSSLTFQFVTPPGGY